MFSKSKFDVNSWLKLKQRSSYLIVLSLKCVFMQLVLRDQWDTIVCYMNDYARFRIKDICQTESFPHFSGAAVLV